MISLYVESNKMKQMNLFTKQKQDSQTQRSNLRLLKGKRGGGGIN